VRLFECACCRRVWHHFSPYYRNTVEVAERFADGQATLDELFRCYQITRDTPKDIEGDFDPAGEGEEYDPYCVPWPGNAATATAFSPGGWDEQDASSWAAELAAWTRPKHLYQEERKAQAHLLRDVFGNPFRPKPPPKGKKRWVAGWRNCLAWNGGTVVRLARECYRIRAFDTLPVLADALEEAGCTDADVLDHCRGPGPHVRACWVVDLVLGKE
jgi:hypothetical protein